MDSLAIATPRAPARRTTRRPPPSPRRIGTLLLGAAAALASSVAISTVAYLRLPAPTGAQAVGRTEALLADGSRTETRSATGDPRHVRLTAWYPAVPGSGEAAPYVPDYDAIRHGLERSGELSPAAVAALAFAGSSSRSGAEVADGGAWPVILLSPGNATNVSFYGALAEDLASHGYVVVGIDHPYQVTAVDVGTGVAVYEGDAPLGETAAVGRRIDERLADITFVLDRLRRDAAGIPVLRGQLDLDRIGIAGHSNGGIAAAATCQSDTRVDACVNIDGQAMGGPFSADANPAPPTKPFMFLTKEVELHPALADLFESGGEGTYRVVVPAAGHETFADGARFVPRLAPIDGLADHVLTIERGFVRAFFDRTLRSAPESVFSGVAAGTDVFVEVYPLGDRPHLPTEQGRAAW